MKKALSIQGVLSVALLSSFNVSAGLMIERYDSGVATPGTLGGWSLVDIGDTGPSDTSTNSISSSAFTGSIDFKKKNGDSLNMRRKDVSDLSWWNNPEATDNEAFITSEFWVELILPENTRALAFNVGANTNLTGWTVGYSDGGSSTGKEYFNFGPQVSPGFGIYANNSGGECSSIKSVVIDPSIRWGFGNLSISQSDQCNPVSVPEPGVVSLLGLGLLGLGLARRKSA